MKQKLIRAAAAVVATVGIAAGSVVAAGPAQAQAEPLDLVLTGGVSCSFGKPGDPWVNSWYMERWLKVTAYGRNWPNVTLQEFNGEQRFAQSLTKGDSLEIKTKWFGCFPSSISGGTISSDIDPLLNNIGFWANVKRIDNKAPEAPTPVPVN